MKTHNIPLELIVPKKPTKCKIEDGEIHIPSEEKQMHKSRHHLTIPGKYRLPLCIDMKVSLQFICANQVASQLRVYIGNENVYFNGAHVSCDDFFAPIKTPCESNKTANYVLYNSIPAKDYVDISLNFGSEMMWVSVDGEYCYTSNKFAYFELLQENTMSDGFINGIDVALVVGTDTKLKMKSFKITEYENDEPKIPDEVLNLPELSEFDLFVNGLPRIIHDDVFKLDEFLLNDMKSLKFRRTIDKTNHLFYASPCGFQYAIREFGVGENHETRWVQSAKKPDLTNRVIQKLNETSPELAEKMFNKLQVCNPTHKPVCPQRTDVALNNETRFVCMSKIRHEMFPEEFEDVKQYISALSDVIKNNVALQ